MWSPVRVTMRKHKQLLIILLLILVLSYCTFLISNARGSIDKWPMFRNDPARSGYTDANTPAGSVELLWTYEAVAAVRSSPAVADGYVFVGSSDWNVYWFNASTGELLGHFLTGGEVHSSPAVDNGCLYVSSGDGNVYCLDITTGMPLWTSPVGGFLRSSPAVVDDRVYVGSGNHDLFCLNASNGVTLWRYQTSDRVQSAPAVSDGIVYFASDDFQVYALNASTGSELWRTHTGSLTSSPCVHEGYVYIGSIDSYVYALNASTGDKVWEYPTENSMSSSPAVAYGCVYVGSEDNSVYCLNATTGEKIWQTPTGYWVKSSPSVADGKVYVGSEDNSIYCFDAFSGEKKWSYETGSYVDSSPAIVNSTLYVGSCDHKLYAFALGDSTDSLPPQSTNSVPWTTIVFDALACTVGAVAIYVLVRFVREGRRAKQNLTERTFAGKMGWFSAHADALCIVAILAFSAVFFVNLGSGPLWVADEQTYSQWAFHMFKTGEYLEPWGFGGPALWIGKPPLFMWLMSLSYQVFGVTNLAARFWSPIFGALSLVLVFYLGKKLYNLPVGFLSALVLGTFNLFYVFSRHAMTDVPFHFFMVASLYFMFLSEETEDAKRYVVLSGLFFGLALMTKQIIALLIPIIAFVYFIATRRGVRFLFTRRFAWFWGVAFLIVSPWVVYMTLRFGPEFWRIFLVYSNFTRAASAIEGHAGGYLFYLNYLVNNDNLLWLILLPFSVGLCVFNSVFKRAKEDTLLLVWMAVVVGLFTFAQTKLEWYILPAFPAFAIAIGSFLYMLLKKTPSVIRFVLAKTREIIGIIMSWTQR